MAAVSTHFSAHVRHYSNIPQEQIRLKEVLAGPLSALQETARHIAEVSNECKLEVAEDEFVESFRPSLMDIIYAWSQVTIARIKILRHFVWALWTIRTGDACRMTRV
jgi:superfamily II RNA helicase